MESVVPQAVRAQLELGQSPSALLIWRSGCFTSRYMLPYWQRLAERHSNKRVLSVCQDGQELQSDYCRQNGILHEVVCDSPKLAISRALQIDDVPSYWILDTEGSTLLSGVGWSKETMIQADQLLSQMGEPLSSGFFGSDEDVISFKPG